MKPLLSNRYQPLGLVYAGANSNVYRGSDNRLQREVAIKIFLPEVAGNEAFYRRFQTGIREVSRLSEPHIARVFDAGESRVMNEAGSSELQIFVVSELVVGKHLPAVFLELNPRLDQCIQVVLEVAKALEAAHGQGVVHGNINPSSVLYTPAKTVKVTGFGITAALLDAGLKPGGEGDFFAPEIRESGRLTTQSDVYSLTALLYWLVTGQAPELTIEMRQPRPDLPQELIPVFITGLNPRPQERFPTAREFIQAVIRQPRLSPPTQAMSLREEIASEVIMPQTATAMIAGVGPSPTTETVAVETPLSPFGPLEDLKPETGKKNRAKVAWAWIGGIAGAGVILALSLWLVQLTTIGSRAPELLPSSPPATDTVTVPNVVGQEQETAAARLRSDGLQVEINPVNSADVPAGQVVSLNPQVGQSVQPNSRVVMAVSNGQVQLPNVVGKPLSEAMASLRADSLKLNPQAQENHSCRQEGLIVNVQSPQPGLVPQKSRVVLSYCAQASRFTPSPRPESPQAPLAPTEQASSPAHTTTAPAPQTPSPAPETTSVKPQPAPTEQASSPAPQTSRADMNSPSPS